MARHYALGISYTGTRFHGYQYQNEATPTVQAALEQALSVVADETIRVTCAGRTDSGVHATKQVVNFTTSNSRPERAWIMGTNAHLPDDVSVDWAREVDSAFSARFSAVARRYCYVIYNCGARSAIGHELYAREHRALDADKMHAAGQFLLGKQDFTSFRAAHCQANNAIRTIHHLRVSRQGDLIFIDVKANAFLHHMVRNITGVLSDIGAGIKPVSWITELLALKDRKVASMTAPAKGLYFIDVVYPDYPELPQGVNMPHFLSLIPLEK